MRILWTGDIKHTAAPFFLADGAFLTCTVLSSFFAPPGILIDEGRKEWRKEKRTDIIYYDEYVNENTIEDYSNRVVCLHIYFFVIFLHVVYSLLHFRRRPKKEISYLLP